MLARLGVNLDHIATLRQLRGTPYPDLTEALRCIQRAGANQVTVHLREDRRHIQDQDVRSIKREALIPLNLEMAATEEMLAFALKIRPEWVCIVPEKRREVTTEGGLDLVKGKARIAKITQKLERAGTRVSLFVEPSLQAVKLSKQYGASAVELHTGAYCLAAQTKGGASASKELARIEHAAREAAKQGMGAHVGHGFDYENVRPVAALEHGDRKPLIEEFNIGHAIVCRAAIVGLERATREMLASIHAP